MDPFIGGALISGAASLLGGALDRRSVGSQTAEQMAAKIRTGARFGLHPSTAIGASTGAPQPFFAGALGRAGEAIERGMTNKAQAAANAKAGELVDAQIAEARSRTMLNLVNAKRAGVGPGSPVDPFARRKMNALVEVLLEDGTIVTIPNPEVYELSPTELATGRAVIETARGLQILRRGADGNWTVAPVESKRPPDMARILGQAARNRGR